MKDAPANIVPGVRLRGRLEGPYVEKPPPHKVEWMPLWLLLGIGITVGFFGVYLYSVLVALRMV